MVCDDCTQKLGTLSAPDPWKVGDSSRAREVGENKLLRKGVRSNPYGSCCRICKMKVQQHAAMYCTVCAYAKGMCSICGALVLETAMYKMSDGGNALHKVGQREQAAFKSAEQIAREGAQEQLLEYLACVGQVGRMPPRPALEAAGKHDLTAALVASFGGLHAAADAMGLSKRLLNEEAEAKRLAKRQVVQAAAGALENAAAESAPVGRVGTPSETAAAEKRGGGAPPGVAPPARLGAGPRAGTVHRQVALDERASDVWQYDPNSGLFFQLSSQAYWDAKVGMYFMGGNWSDSLGGLVP